MNDHTFNKLCETYGMAPTKPLRDLVEAAVKQEREACAEICMRMAQRTQDIRRAALEMAAEYIHAMGQL